MVLCAVYSVARCCGLCWRRVAPVSRLSRADLVVPRSIAAAPRVVCARAFATSKGDGGSNDDEFVFDPTLSVQKDAAVNMAKKSLGGILCELLPSNAPEKAKEKVKLYLQQHPIDNLIVHPKVQITHVEDPESGAEAKMSLTPCDLSEALQQAQELSMNLVQMGTSGDVAYCRIRREAPRILTLVSAELEALNEQGEQERPAGRGAGDHGAVKLRELIDHQFRDVVDAHFVGWKSKKIVDDIRKRHPVKLTIKEFQSIDSAIGKLREMCQAMQRYAEEKTIYHHFSSIVANEREASVTFTPSLPSAKSGAWKHIKYPGEKEWAHAKKRMEEACRSSGRYSTYTRNNTLKPRSLGQTLYRVDKYGRKIE